MEIKSNGYFKTRDFDIDTNEDIDIYDLDDNGDIVANLMVWGYDKLINNLKIFPKKLTDNEEESLIYNCYIEFTQNGKYWFTISFYDYDEEWLDKSILEKVREINQEIRIEINTEEEKEIFKNKVNKALEILGIDDIKEIFEEE